MNTEKQSDVSTVEWLMEGDPAIRWQALRDLLHASEEEWQAERRRTLEEGWGARLLSLQNADGGWGEGVYAPKWTSTTYTLLALCDIGIPSECDAARRGAEIMVTELLGAVCGDAFRERLAACDRCIVGMLLRVMAYFRIGDDRIPAIVENLLAEQMPDKGWNCRRHRRPYPKHSSFHTTFNVLEGLWEVRNAGYSFLTSEIQTAEREALEFMLQHRLFKSDKTGEVVKETFTVFVYPHRWQYNAFRGLAYFARADFPYDSRLEDAMALLHERRDAYGRWPTQRKLSGKVFFDMEKVGPPSRWNTLRALRILQWWERVQSEERKQDRSPFVP
jgi:hypothetical protein